MPKVVEPQIPNYPPQGIQAQLDLLYLWNPDAANELIKQLEEAIKEVQSNLDYNKLVNKPTLDTTSTNALVAGTEEVAGVVKLHKVSKTGSYEDLNDQPDLDLYATKTALAAGLESKADLSTVNTIRTDLDDLGDQVHEIESKVPAAASADNQLADKAFVNSSINAVAAYYITSTPEGDSFATKADLDNGPYYFQGAARVPTTNDYALVKADETHGGSAARYMYDGKQWDYQYTLNDTPFTQAQVDAINSGITAGLVSKYNTTADTVDALDSEVGTLKTEMTTAQSDIGALKTASNTQAGLISDLQNDKADKTALPQNQTGTAGQVYTKTETGAEWQDASGGSSLPDQTGNAGKFLTTDGTNASWGGGYCAEAKNFVDYTTVVLDAKNYVTNFDRASVVISPTSKDTPQDLSTTIFARMGGLTSVGIGFGAYAGGDDSISVGGLSSATAPGALAIGYSATATAAKAIQLGTGTNSASSTFQVFDKQLMDANGHIPSERLASDGTTGQVLSKTDTGMEWKTVSGGGSSADNNGLEGDYCSKYGIVDETASGLPTQGTGNQIIIPAQLVMDVPGVAGLTTNESVITHDLVSTTDCEIFLAEGTVIEATDVFFQTDEPQNGATGYAAWWNGTEWKFKSNDTGNVWRAANAVRIAKCIFTDGALTRLCFTGCRVLDKQEWLPLSGGTMTGPIKFHYTGSSLYIPQISNKSSNIQIGSAWDNDLFVFEMTGTGKFRPGSYSVDLGDKTYKWRCIYGTKLNNGEDIAVPTTGGTMVVATPPTAAGNYVLKATVAEDGTVTTQWVAEA